MTTLSFTVAGTPVPQGSHRLINNRVIPDKRLVAWRQLVTAEALTAAEAAGWDDPLDWPCQVEAIFYLAPPLKPRWWVPAVKPDVDKLLRAVFDALSPRHDGRVLTDDSRVARAVTEKHYADAEHPPGAHITITPLEHP